MPRPLPHRAAAHSTRSRRRATITGRDTKYCKVQGDRIHIQRCQHRARLCFRRRLPMHLPQRTQALHTEQTRSWQPTCSSTRCSYSGGTSCTSIQPWEGS